MDNNTYGVTINRFSFPTMTRTTLSATRSVASWQAGGACNIGVAGYLTGGAGAPGFLDVIDRFALPVETRSILAAVLSVGRTSAQGAFSDCGVL
jgi:hypothetical protein